MPDYPASYEHEDILAQVFMAFGQGAGTMHATPAAVRAGRLKYGPTLKVQNWDADAPQVLEFARALGRVAANLAAQEGSTAIDEQHFRRASELVIGHQIGPWSCPYCPPVGKPGGRPPDLDPGR